MRGSYIRPARLPKSFIEIRPYKEKQGDGIRCKSIFWITKVGISYSSFEYVSV